MSSPSSPRRIRLGPLTMSLTRPFTPALVPPAARPLVEAPLTLVRRFASIFLCLSLLLLSFLACVLVSLPFRVPALNPLVRGVLAVVSLTVFSTALIAANANRLDVAANLAHLRALCNADVHAAKPLALDLATDAPAQSDSVASALALMDGVTRVDTPATSTAAADAAAPPDHPHAHEGSRLLPKPPGPFEDAPAQADAVMDGSLRAVRAAMEADSLYVFDRVLDGAMASVFTHVVSLPLLCFFGGYVLCELGAPFSGAELVMGGFVTCGLGTMAWASVRAQATEMLGVARVEVRRLGLAEMERQKAKEIEQEENRIRQAEIVMQIAVRCVAEKEEELRSVRAASEESRRQITEQPPKFFGIPLPFEMNPFPQREEGGEDVDEEGEEGEGKDGDDGDDGDDHDHDDEANDQNV